jgi:hypothetical protein
MAAAGALRAYALVLRDDRRSAPIPQDEGYTTTRPIVLMLRDREAIVSKHEGVLANACYADARRQ